MDHLGYELGIVVVLGDGRNYVGRYVILVVINQFAHQIWIAQHLKAIEFRLKRL